MHEPLYSRAIKKSWHLAWNHKLLWPFGLFAAFLGQMGILEFLTKSGMTAAQISWYPAWLLNLNFFNLNLDNSSLNLEGWVWLLVAALITLGFIALFVFAAVSSQGAIIHSTAKSIGKNNFPNEAESWHSGVKHFWKVFVINLLKKFIIFILLFFISKATYNTLTIAKGADYFLFFVIFLLSSAVGFLVSFLSVYAAGYVVVEEYPLVKAIVAAWKLFTNHWLVSMEVGLIVLGCNIALLIISVLGFFLLFLPTILIWFIAVLVGSSLLYSVGLYVGLILFTFFILFIGSVFTVFTTAVWTHLFMKMNRIGVWSRVVHYLSYKKA